MYFSVVALLLFALAPLGFKMAEAYYVATQWEQRAVAIDNAAIVLGKADRLLFRKLQTLNAAVRAADLFHHPVHFSPWPWTKAGDPAIEAKLIALRQANYVAVSVLWTANKVAALTSPSLNDETRGHVVKIRGRNEKPPIHQSRCPVCGLAIYWEVDGEATRTFTLDVPSDFSVPGVRLRIVGDSVLSLSDWDYELERL